MPSWTSAALLIHAREEQLNPNVQFVLFGKGVRCPLCPPLTGALRATPWLA